MNSSYNFILEENGQILRHFLLNNESARQHASYNLILEDLKTVNEAFNLLISRGEPNRQIEKFVSDEFHLFNANESVPDELILDRALYTTAIIYYGKCFAEAKGRKIKLNVDIIKVPELHTFHKDLIHQRNKYVAHADESPFEEAFTFYLERDKKIVTLTKQLNNYGYDRLNQYLKVVKFLIEYSQRKIQKLANKIIQDIHFEGSEIIKNKIDNYMSGLNK